MRNLFLIVIGCIALAACFGISDANGCSCTTPIGGSSPCLNYSEAPVVFVGKVSAIEKGKEIIQYMGKSEEIGSFLLAHFDIERSYKGLPDNQTKVNIGTSGNCGANFVEGKRYLVFARKIPDGDELLKVIHGISLNFDLLADGCDKTRLMPEGQNDLDLIEALVGGKPESRIYGQVTLIERDLIKGHTGDNFKSAPGIKIEALNESHAFEAITDKNGKFLIRNVPPGKYKVQPMLPSTQSGYLGLNKTETVEISPPQRCGTEHIFLIQNNGVISGRLFDSEGKPAGRNVEVSLITADSAINGPSAFAGSPTWTKDGGIYEFNGLTPGNYILGIGLLRPPSWRSPFFRYYYPSTSQLSDAKNLHLGEGEKLNNINIHLPQPLEVYSLKGRVLDGDVHPTAGAQVQIFDIELGMSADIPQTLNRTNTDGTFTVTAIKNRRYLVRAYRLNNYDRTMSAQSDPVEITADDSSKPPVLTLNKPYNSQFTREDWLH